MKPPLLEEVARSAGGVAAGELCSPLRCMFHNCIKPHTGKQQFPRGNSRGGCPHPPVVLGKLRANHVRPYGIPFQESRDDVGIVPYE